MIFLAFLQIIVATLKIIFSILPNVDVLPFGIDSILVQGVGYVHYVASIFPPIQSILSGFLYVVGFKIVLKVIRLIPWFGRVF